MEEQEQLEKNSGSCECCGECNCDCECCQKCRAQKKEQKTGSFASSFFRMNDTVGASFLGILAIMLLVFLVRSNKRNRELLLEVIELQRQA